MDIRRIIITAMIYVAAMAHAAAQNRIDGMMENYSSHGMSKYTRLWNATLRHARCGKW